MYEQFQSDNVALTYQNKIPIFHIKNTLCSGLISPYGAHVLGFQPAGFTEVLMISEKSNWEPGKPIRGGVPICLPHFGDGAQPLHGVARLTFWNVVSIAQETDGSTTVIMQLDLTAPVVMQATMKVNFGTALTMKLTSLNTGTKELVISNALHTYLQVKDIRHCRIAGLDGFQYYDELLPKSALAIQTGDIVIDREWDRNYLSDSSVEVVDPDWQRCIRVAKSGSGETMVWNPWVDKSARLPDFGAEEYLKMVCVEAINSDMHAIKLAPGAHHELSQVIYLLAQDNK